MIAPHTSAANTASPDSAISVHELWKVYSSGALRRSKVQALKNVSLHVRRGEIFGLLGPNGAGKTTLIKVLLGIASKTNGDAQLLGRRAGDRASRRRVGYLPEHHRIPRHHTGYSALRYYGALSGLSFSQVRANRDALLDRVGLTGWGNHSVKKYSKGMLQRLGLAQAIAHDPELIILDEPTDGVDPVGREEMRAILKELKSQGKTIFLNSHLLHEVELVCDRVAILDKGEVLHCGHVEELTIPAQSQTTFVLQGQPQVIASVLQIQPQHLVPVQGSSRFQVSLAIDGQPQVDAWVDRLRAQQVSIESMTPYRQSLEDAFLELIRRVRGAA